MSDDNDRFDEVAAFACSLASRDEAAGTELLGMIHDLVPFVAASLNTFDPLTGDHRMIANDGYSEHALRHFDTWFVQHDEVFAYMRNVDPKPLRWRDMPFSYREMYSAQEVFLPAGYVEGLTVCFYSLDWRYTGSLHLSVEETTRPSDGQMRHLYRLQRVLGGFVDRLATLAWQASACGGNAVAVGSGGRVVGLPGVEPGPLLFTGSRLIDCLLRCHGSSRVPRCARWRDEGGLWHRIDVLQTAGGLLVAQREEALPLDITERELEVLTELLSGAGNAHVAKALYCSTKTIAKHVEHILEKLECETRTAAAVKALGLGLVSLRSASHARQPSRAPAYSLVAADGLPIRIGGTRLGGKLRV